MSGFTSRFSSYTLTQLNELLEDDEKLDKIVQELEEVQEVQKTKEMTLASNRSLAEQNLLLQPKLDCQKNELTKRYRQLQELFEAFQFRKSTLDHNSGNGSLDTLLALLQAEGAKIEEETENMADSFLEGNLSLECFSDEYQSKRKLSHLRRVKIDKLQEMVLKGHRLPLKTPTTPHSVAPAPFLTEASAAPVPLPRRAPPPPPAQTDPVLYPPIPPRTGKPPPCPISGYPTPFTAQYPPALPQRPPQRLAPQPGFILQ